MKQKIRESGIKISFSLLTILGSFTYFMIFAAINGTLGSLLASGVTISGVCAISKYLNETFNIGVAINLPYYSFIIICLVCGLLRGVLRYVEQYSNHYIAFKLLAILRDKLFICLRKLAPSKVDDKNKGSLISMLTSDVETLEVFYAHTLSPICIAFLYFITIFLFIGFIFSFYLSLVFLLAYLVIGIILPIIYSKSLEKVGVEYRTTFADFNSFFLDSIKGVKEINLNDNSSSRKEKLDTKNKILLDKTKLIKQKTSLCTCISEFAVTFFIFLSLAIGLILVIYLGLPFNMMLIGVCAIFSGFGPALSLANLPSNLNQTFASGDRILKLLKEQPLTKEITSKQDFVFNNLEVNNLSFSYDNQINILDDVSFKVNKGEIIGIIGDSGSGKSTILKLLLRFYNANSGSIKYNNIDINQINTTSLLNNVTLVSQSTYLFDDTILNNLKIANKNASLEQIKQACKKASIDQFIESLKDGYESRVGQLGDNISAGEKQRIGLARAFLSNANLILLDEPTSNVDSINEGIILNSIKQECKDKTVILVSHRKSTMAICNRIYKIEKGKIVE